jgi:hypothetical protein
MISLAVKSAILDSSLILGDSPHCDHSHTVWNSFSFFLSLLCGNLHAFQILTVSSPKKTLARMCVFLIARQLRAFYRLIRGMHDKFQSNSSTIKILHESGGGHANLSVVSKWKISQKNRSPSLLSFLFYVSTLFEYFIISSPNTLKKLYYFISANNFNFSSALSSKRNFLFSSFCYFFSTVFGFHVFLRQCSKLNWCLPYSRCFIIERKKNVLNRK